MRRNCLLIAMCVAAVVAGCGGDHNSSSELQELAGTTKPVETTTSVASLTLTTSADSAVADGASSVVIRATVRGLDGTAMADVPVAFTTSFGGFADAGGAGSVTKATDQTGLAQVTLVSTTSPALAFVTASTDGFTDQAQVHFVPGPPDATHSSVTANPKIIVADGASVTTVTVSLADANGLPVSDGTQVTLAASLGTITSVNPAATLSGRAEFTLRAAASQGQAQLTVPEVPDISDTVTFGVEATTGEPAGIRLAVAQPEIAVAGVGQVEETQFIFEVVDARGDPIGESGYGDPTIDNLRVRYATRPNGGEYITGVNATGEVVTASDAQSLLIRTHDGSATLNLHSGILPGAIELRAEFLVDSHGQDLAAPITANLPLAAIAAGPPHSIVLTHPFQDAIQPMQGVYRMVGKAIVNDRYGNPVPDGTAVYLGVLDSVIASGTASVTGDLLAGAAGDFDRTVIRNDEPPRGIQATDRVLLFSGIAAQDKSRFVATVPAAGGDELQVQSAYSSDYAAADYVVGASLLGAHVLGSTGGESAVLTSGLSRTKEGLADVYLDYPANVRTLNVGCGLVPLIDTRHLPVGSAEVLLVAESASDPGPVDLDPTAPSEDRAVTVSPDFCFAPLAGFTLDARPSALGGPGQVVVGVRDGTDVPVAFEQVVAGIVDITAPEGAAFVVTATSCITDAGAACTSQVTVSGDTVPGEYGATIRYQAGDGSTQVTVKFVR